MTSTSRLRHQPCLSTDIHPLGYELAFRFREEEKWVIENRTRIQLDISSPTHVIVLNQKEIAFMTASLIGVCCPLYFKCFYFYGSY